MTNFLVLTVISDDKPGVVETLAKTITEHGGNWLECRMSHLAGKFAGILRVSVEIENLEEPIAPERASSAVPRSKSQRKCVDEFSDNKKFPTPFCRNFSEETVCEIC